MNPIDRRSVLRAGLLVAGGAALAACGGENRKPSFIAPDGEQVRKLEAARRGAGGAVRDFQLTPAEGTIDLGGRTVFHRLGERRHAAHRKEDMLNRTSRFT